MTPMLCCLKRCENHVSAVAGLASPSACSKVTSMPRNSKFALGIAALALVHRQRIVELGNANRLLSFTQVLSSCMSKKGCPTLPCTHPASYTA